MNIYIPYTYLIGWSKHNKWYYGRRTAKGCNPSEFWVSYFTSSKYVDEFRKEHGEPDIIQIRKTFNDIDHCKLWESKFLRKVDAQHNPSFLNKKNGDSDWDTTGISRPLNKQEKESIRSRMVGNKIAKGKPKTEEHKNKLSQSQKGISRYWLIGSKRTQETKNKQSKSLQGVNKETVTCFDIETDKFVKVPKHIWDSHKGKRYFGTTSKVIASRRQ